MSRRSRSSPASLTPSPRPFGARLVAVSVAVALLGSGCARTRVTMVAKYHPGAPSKVDRTPDVGVYKIKFAAGEAGQALHTLHGSKRLLGKGQPLGFVRADDGAIIAVAGEERFPARLPDGARFCVWYTKSEEPSTFARDLGDTLQFVGGATLAAGLVGALVVLKLGEADDDCRHGHDRDDCRRCRG